MAPVSFIPSAEAAFIAELDQPRMNRIFDDHLVPDELLGQDGGGRGFTRLSAAFARFYYLMDDVFVAPMRRQAIEEVTRRVRLLSNRNEVFNLVAVPREISWKASRHGVEIDLLPWVLEVSARAKDVALADKLVVVDPEILSGEPTFAGTRVPIENVIASIDHGEDLARLQASYPFLTEAHVEAARTYAAVHPRRGRPRRLSDNEPVLKAGRSRIVRPARA